MGGNHHIFQNATSVLHKRICLSVGEDEDDYGRAVVRVGILAHDFRIQARYLIAICGVFDGYDNGRLSASSRGRGNIWELFFKMLAEIRGLFAGYKLVIDVDLARFIVRRAFADGDELDQLHAYFSRQLLAICIPF